MSRKQLLILNLVGGLCAVLVLANLAFNRMNRALNRSLTDAQNRINSAQQVQTTFQNLVLRVAQGATTDAALRTLMTRHDLKVNLTVDGEPKQIP